MAKGSPNITDVVRSLGSGKKASATTLLTEVGVQNAAVIAKLRKPNAFQEVARDDKEVANVLNYAELKRVSDFIGKRKKDSENITKLFPDVELAKQIYVSSVIAPKDMTQTDILYEVDDSLFPAEVVTKANECIKNTIEKEYKIDEDLQDILRESLFETGSYVVATLPESTIDEVINSDRSFSLEAASTVFEKDGVNIKPLGYLSDDTDSMALESFFSNPVPRKLKSNDIIVDNENLGISVYDNFEMLKLPKLMQAVSSQSSVSIIDSVRYRRPSLEASDVINIRSTGSVKGNLTSEEIRSTVFKAPTTGNTPVVTLNTQGNSRRKSVGRALRMQLPSEAVLPIYPPGEPHNHIGYFILLDHDGAPLSVESQKGYMDGITGMMNSNLSQNQSTGLNSYLLKKAKDTIVGNDSVPTLTDMTRVYSSIVEKELVSRLKNGVNKRNLVIGNNDEIYRMMMYRALSGQATRMLYVPAELITYYAYRYHPNGVGKSMLDDLTMLISTRAVVMAARVMQQIRSSINSTNVQVELDGTEDDPEKVMEVSVANVMKFLQFQMPVGLVTQADIYEWVARAGVRFTFTGHPGLPEIKYDFTNDTIGNTTPDTDLDEDLRRRTYMAFGLSPEQVDNSLSPDFATSVLANNALLSKRVMNTQKVYCELLSEDAKKIMRYDTLAYHQLKTIIRENLDAIKRRIKDSDHINDGDVDEENIVVELTDRYIDKITLSLPKPDLTTIENQQEALEKAEGFIDKLLESYASSEAFPEMVSGDATNSIEQYKGVLKAALVRQWVADNPSFKDINDIIMRVLDKDGKTTIFDMTSTHIKGFVGSMMKFMKESKPFANAATRDIQTIESGEGIDDEDNSMSGSYTDDDQEQSAELPDERSEDEDSQGDESYGSGSFGL